MNDYEIMNTHPSKTNSLLLYKKNKHITATCITAIASYHRRRCGGTATMKTKYKPQTSISLSPVFVAFIPYRYHFLHIIEFFSISLSTICNRHFIPFTVSI